MSKSNDKKLRLKRETVTALTSDDLSRVGGGVVVVSEYKCGPLTKGFECQPPHPVITTIACPRPGI